MCNGLPSKVAVRKRCSDPPVFQTPPYRYVDGALRGLRNTPHHRPIRALYGMIKKLLGKLCKYVFSFGHDEQAGGIFVNTMYQAGPSDIAGHMRKILSERTPMEEMVSQRIHQRSGPVLVSGMNHHTRRFIDHQQILVLENNIEGNILRNYLGVTRRLRKRNRNDVVGMNFAIRFDGLLIYFYKPVVN